MDRGGVSMDAGHQDLSDWDWEVLPDHMSSSMCHESAANLADDQETKEPVIMPPSSDDADVQDEPVDKCKDIGVVLEETVPKKEEAMPEVTDPPAPCEGAEEERTFQSPGSMKTHDEEEASEGEVEEKTLKSPGTTKAQDEKFHEEEASEGEVPDTEEAPDEKFDEEAEEENAMKKDNGGARPDCAVFSVGKLKVNGIGALCSFGVAAATVCVFLIGGRMQHHHRQQQQKIQLPFYGDDKRIQQVVQQTSRLNQAVSSVVGGGGISTRANISFGGFYDGF